MPLREISPSTGYTDPIYFGPHRLHLGISTSVIDEVFASLEYLSEVEEVSRKFLESKGNNPQAIPKLILIFRSYVRQAKAFFQSALTLHHRASALIYYYSFLNLAKAFLCTTDANSVTGRVPHGLSYIFSDGSLKEQVIRVQQLNGVFPLLYSKITQHALPNDFPLEIVNLLGYCSDISHEFQTAGYGEHRCLPAKVRILIDVNQKHSFLVVAVQRFSALEPYTQALTEFHARFEEVKPRRQITGNQFDITEPNVSVYRFFESQKKYKLLDNDLIPVQQILDDLHASSSKLRMSNPFRDEFECYLVLPWNLKHQVPFNELFAIYATMFYLGSLVRYNPEYLERLINSKDGWLIERFCSSCTITCLRHMGNMIEGVDKVYYPR